MISETINQVLASIQTYLNPEIFQSEERLQSIAAALVAGKLVVVREALQEAFAERMFGCLDQISNWKAYESFQSYFHYHHHNLYDPAQFPPDLTFCANVFSSAGTRAFIERLARRDCSAEAIFSPSLYLPGDYSLPHTDFVPASAAIYRQVAFVWHLTKNWQPHWGGDFFWCPASRYLSPTFNTLILFLVGPDSYHCVTQVSPYAQVKRMAINGWWTGKDAIVERSVPTQVVPGEDRPLVEII